MSPREDADDGLHHHFGFSPQRRFDVLEHTFRELRGSVERDGIAGVVHDGVHDPHFERHTGFETSAKMV